MLGRVSVAVVVASAVVVARNRKLNWRRAWRTVSKSLSIASYAAVRFERTQSCLLACLPAERLIELHKTHADSIPAGDERSVVRLLHVSLPRAVHMLW